MRIYADRTVCGGENRDPTAFPTSRYRFEVLLGI